MNPNQKANIVLVMEDISSHHIQLMRLNPWDALMFQRILLKDKAARIPGSRSHRIALYALNLGTIVQGSDPIDSIALERNAEFIRLKAQAKFFNGETTYTDEELGALKDWIRTKGASKIGPLFTNVILKNKQQSTQSYAQSRLRTFLNIVV